MISREIYRGLFQNRFLNLSLISRFPLYVHFPATVRGNRLSGAYSPLNNILCKIVPWVAAYSVFIAATVKSEN